MGILFNFVFSNGQRSTKRDWKTNYYDHPISEDAIPRIRAVDIHYSDYSIRGFSFFDKDGALLYKIGNTYPGFGKEKIQIEENERIVGVKAKLFPGRQS